jgi:SpoVK/Ycf46/Vps4 family AAA+-type ATPase
MTNGNNDLMILLFAFLMFFRGDGFGGRDRDRDHHHGGEGFMYGRETLRMEQFNKLDLDNKIDRLEGKIDGNYKSLLAMGNEKETRDSIRSIDKSVEHLGFHSQKSHDEIKCAIHTEGEKTRHLMVELEQKETIRRQAEEIAGLKQSRLKDEILDGVAGMQRSRDEARGLTEDILAGVSALLRKFEPSGHRPFGCEVRG